MANMSYCRFRNTLADLRECYEHMDEQLSEGEQAALERLVALCKRIADEYEEPT